MNEPSQEFIENTWKTVSENYKALRETGLWTPTELYDLFETAVRIGWDGASEAL